MRKVLIGSLVAVCSLMLAGSTQAQPKRGDILYQNDFKEIPQATDWRFDASKMQWEKEGDSSRLRVENPVAGGKSDTKLFIPLPIEKLRGLRIKYGALVKAQDVAKPATDYNGVKVMLNIVNANDRHNYPQQNNVHGTFDAKRVEWVTTIPRDAKAAYLVLGLEATTGTAWFDDIKISVATAPRVRPAQPATGPVYTGHPGIPRLRGAMIRNTIPPDSARLLGQTWNANVVRFQFVNWGAPIADESYDKWLDGQMELLDKFLPEAQKNGLKVVIDLHTPPGGRDALKQDRFFHEQKYQDKLIEVWDKISRRYRDNKTIWGYDLVNEPFAGPMPDELLDWHGLVTKMAQTIRRNNDDHAIIVQPENGGYPNAIEYLEPIPVPGIVYSIHMYIPFQYTHQGVFSNLPMGQPYPGKSATEVWDKEHVRAALAEVIAFQRDYNAHIFVGEFGVVRWAPGAAQWLSDAIDVFEENGWDWTYHAFREWHGWSMELGPNKEDQTPGSTPTDSEKILRQWLAKNQKPI